MHPHTLKGKRLRIFVGEAALWQGKPLYQALLETARQHGMMTVTVTRGIEGFGPEHHLSTERLLDVSDNLPIVVDIIDQEEQIDALLPHLDALVLQGMITAVSVEIVRGWSA